MAWKDTELKWQLKDELKLKEENKDTTIGDKDHCHYKTGNLKKEPTVKKK